MDFIALREALRAARDQADLTLDEAAAATGLNRATIHAIENLRLEPILKPELETIEKLVVSYKMTLSSFFARIEALPTGPPLTEDRIAPAELADHESLPSIPSETEAATAAAEFLVERVRRLEDQLERLTRERRQDHRHAAAAGPTTTPNRAARGTHHARDARRAKTPRSGKRKRS